MAVMSCGRGGPPVGVEAPVAPAVRAPVVSEERVSATTRLLHRRDGTTTAVVTAGPSGYQDALGAWKEIRTDLKATKDGFLADENLVRARFPATLGDGRSIRFEDRTGLGFSWRPEWPQGVTADVSALGGTARYRLHGALEGVVEEFLVQRGTVKHNLVLESREALDRALVALPDGALGVAGHLQLDPGVSLETRGEALALAGPGGKIFDFPGPRAFEFGENAPSTQARFRWDADAGLLWVEVDANWLKAEGRRFPLAIDPPATVMTGFAATVYAPSSTGPGSALFSGLRVGSLSSSEYYQIAVKFETSAIDPTTTVTSASVNTYFTTGGASFVQTFHYARLTLDPETSQPAMLWTNGTHGATPDYATFSSAGNCDCWVNGGNPATQTGTLLGATGASDLQASLSQGRFLVGLHVPSFTNGRYATLAGMVDLNQQQLYIDYTTGVPVVSQVSPASAPFGPGAPLTIRGTNFRSGLSVQLINVLGGAPIAVPGVAYLTASQIQATLPALPVGVYDVVVTTVGGTSVSTLADRFTVSAVSTWTGTSSSSWADASNWSPPATPLPSSDVVIPVGTPPCQLDVASASVLSVSLTGGALVFGTGSLTVAQDVNLGSGSLSMVAGGAMSIGRSFLVASGTFASGAGTVTFANPMANRQSLITTGLMVWDDFETGAIGWTNTTTTGGIAWRIQESYSASPSRAWYQQGSQLTQGGATLVSPSFNLSGKSTAVLRWKHRYRISPEDSTGPNTADGFVVQVSPNGGGGWTTIAPTTTDASPHMPKAAGTKCANNSTRTANPVTAGPGGLYAGIQDAFVQESVALPGFALGQPSVMVRFWSGWDNCNDYDPWEGVYIDEVVVTADETPVTFNNLVVSNLAEVSSMTALQVTGNLTVSTANNSLDLNGKGLTVSGQVDNSGVLTRGPGGAFAVTGAFNNSGTFLMGSGPVSTGTLVNAGFFVGGTGGGLSVSGLTNSGQLATGDGVTLVTGPITNIGTLVVRGPGLNVSGDVTNGGTIDLGMAALTLSGSGTATIGGAGIYRESAFRTVLFSDGFESGGFAAGGWVPDSGGCAWTDPAVVNAPGGVGSGSKVVNLPAGGHCFDNWIYKSFSTTGQQGIWVTYGRATTSGAGTYVFDFEFSIDSGATWKSAKSVSGQFGYVIDAVNLSAIDPAVNNNPGFQIRFHSYTSAGSMYHYIDDVTIEAGLGGVGALNITGGTKVISPGDLAKNLQVRGALNLAGGALQVSTGSTLSLANPSAVTSSTAAATVLHVNPGGKLALSANTILNVGGALELLGVAGSPAMVTSTDTITPGRYALNVNGSFNGSYFDIDYANLKGLNLAAGSTVVALDFGSFHHPPTNGALLTLGTAAPPAVSGDCFFGNEASVVGAISVDGSFNNSPIRFDRASGPLAGETHDKDFALATPGNVTWGPTQFGYLTAAQTIPAGACSGGVVLQVMDASFAAAVASSNITFTLSKSSGSLTFYGDSGCVTSTTTALVAAGSSTVTFYFKDTAVEVTPITAAAPGLGSWNQGETITAAPAAKLAFIVQPTNGVAGAALSPSVKVQVQDASGNPVASSTANVVLAFGLNPGLATLSGGGSTAAVAGIATFPALSIDRPGLGYTLVATSGGLTSSTSVGFDIAGGAPSVLAFTTSAQVLAAGTCSALATVEARDALGNLASSGVAATLSSAPATLTFYPAADTTCAGAPITTLSLGPAGSFRFRATVAGLPVLMVSGAGVSSDIQDETINPGPAAKVGFVTQPTSAVAGATISPAVQARLFDAFDNPITSGSPAISLTMGNNPGSGVLTGTVGVVAGGLVTFSLASINRTGIGYTLVAGSGALTSATSLPFDIISGPASKLVFTTSSQTLVAGDCSAPVTLVLEDALDNLATGSVSAAVTGAPPTTQFYASSDTTCTGAPFTFITVNPTASFRFRDTHSGLVSVAAAAGALTPASQIHTYTPGPAAKLAFFVQPPSAVAGAALSPAVRVQVQDAFDNPVVTSTAGVTLAFGANPGTGTLTGGGTVSAIAGIATFAGLSVDKPATGYTLVASSAGGLTSAPSAAFDISGGAATKLVVTTPARTIAAGDCSAPLALEARDALGNPASSVVLAGLASAPATLTFYDSADATCGGAPITTVSLGPTGSFRFRGTVQGGPVITASSAGLTSATQSATVDPGPAAKVGYVTQPSSAIAGAFLSPSVQVRLLDAFDNPLTSGSPVFSLVLGNNPGGGTLTVGAVGVAVAGVVTFPTVSLDKTGTGYTLVAGSGALTSATSSAFDIVGGPAAKLVVTSPAVTVTAGTCSALVAVALRDAFDNPVSTPVTATLASNSPTLAFYSVADTTCAGPAITSLSVGPAASFRFRDTVAGTPSVTASNGALTQANQVETVTPAAASKLAFFTQPASTMAGAAISPAVQVRVLDAFDNFVATSTAPITLALGSNPGAGTLSGGAAVTAVGGVATFLALSVDRAGVGYTLLANSGLFGGSTSLTFDVSPGPATKWVVTSAAQSLAAGDCSSPVAFALEDALGNAAAGPVTAALAVDSTTLRFFAASDSTCTGSTVTSVSAGPTASFRFRDTQAGSPTLTVSGGSLAPAAQTEALAVGPAAKLAFLTQPTGAIAGASFSPAVQVRVTDAFDNPLPSSTASVTLALGTNPGSGTLTGGGPVSAASGTASFPGLSIDRTGVGYTLVAASGTLSGATSLPFNVSGGAAAKLVITSPAVTLAAGACSAPVTAELRDALDNPVSTPVVAALASTSPTLAFYAGSDSTCTGTTVTSISVGPTGVFRFRDTQAGVPAVTASSSGLTPATQDETITPAAGAKLAFFAQPTGATAGVAVAPPVQVRVLDAFGNFDATSSASVALAIGNNPGAGTLSGGASVAAVGGVASFPALSVDRAGVGYTLSATSTLLTSATSLTFDITAGPPTKWVFTSAALSVAAGDCSPPATVALEDTFANLAVGPVTAALTASSTTLEFFAAADTTCTGSTLTSVAANPTASFRFRDTKTGAPTLTASGGSLTPATQTETVAAGAEAGLAFSVQPSTSAAGASLTPAVKVQVVDAYGNSVTTSTSSVALAVGNNPGPGTLSGAAPVAALAGVATFPALSIDRSGVGYTLVASSGLLTTTSLAFDVTANLPANWFFTTVPQSLTAGDCSTPVVVALEDLFGNLAAGPAVASLTSDSTTLGFFAASDATCTGAPLTSLSVGPTASFRFRDNRANSPTVTASGGGLAAANQIEIFAVGAPARLYFLTPPATSSAGAAFTPPVQVQVLDAFDNAVTTSTASITLALGNNPGPGILSGAAAVATVGGVATFPALSVDRAAVGYTLVANSGPLAGATSQPFDITAGAAAKWVFTSAAQNLTAGDCSAPVGVELEDALGNPVAGSTSAALTSTSTTLAFFAASDSSCTGTPVTSVSAAPAASFRFRDNRANSPTLTAASGGGVAPASQTEVLAVGAAARLYFLTPPAASSAGAAFAPPVQVQVLDAFDNAVTTSTAGIALALGTNPGSGTLSGGAAVAAVGGVASFPTLSIDRAAVGYTLVASSGALAGATSQPFDIAAGAAAKLVFTSAAQSLSIGACSGLASLEARDAFENLVGSTAGVVAALDASPATVTFYAASDSTCSGTPLTTLSVAPSASFRFKGTIAGDVALTASSGSLASASQTETFTSVGAVALAFVTAPQTVGAGTCSSLVTVEVEDAAPLPFPVAAATDVALSSTSASALFFSDAACTSAVTTVTVAAGASSAGFYFRDTLAGAETLTAATAGLASATQPEAVLAGPAAALTVSNYPSPTRAGAQHSFDVTLTDAYGNAAAGYVGTLAFTSTDAAALVPAAHTFVPSEAGHQTFQATFRTPGTFELAATDTASSALSGKQAGIVVQPGTAVSLKVSGIASPTKVGLALDVTVEVDDVVGNAVTDYSGTIHFASDDGAAVLPADYSFVAGDAGLHTFTGQLTFFTAGTHAVTATDVSVASVQGAQSGIVVEPNVAPLIVHDANLRGAVGVGYAYNAAGVVRATGDVPMTFSACAGPADFRVDAVSGAVRWTPASAGVADVCVKAKNASGEDTYAFAVDVAATAPAGLVAAFTAVPNEGAAPLAVAFDASASSAASSALPLYFHWAFGDGSSPATGVRASHGYVLPGGYRPRLAAFDSFGSRADVDAQVSVLGAAGNHPPSARIIASAVRGADSLTVALSCDCLAGSAPLASYHWDLGDGTSAAAPTAQVTLLPGRYHVSLTVVDAAGLPAHDKVEVVVTQGTREPPECTAAADPPAGLAPLSTTWRAFAASAAGTIASRQWQFTPGGTAEGASVAKTYDTPGRTLGRLEVADEVGLKCTDAVEVTATAPAGVPPRIATEPVPIAQCGVPYLVSDSGAVTAVGDGPFEWTTSLAPDGFSVDAAAGAVAWTPAPGQRGPQDVTLKVQTASGSDEKSFTVQVECVNDVSFGTQCGCGAGPGGAALAGLLLLAFHVRRRRPADVRADPTPGQ